MHQPALALATTVLLLGCATTPPPAAASIETGRSSFVAPTLAAIAADPRLQAPPRPQQPHNYATLKGGALYPSESDIDPGYVLGGVFGSYFTRNVAIEMEAGYSAADLDAPGADLEAFPLLINVRATFPVGPIEVYGGGGFGSTYYDIAANSFDVEGWLYAFDLFAGAEYLLRENMTVGVELKYYFTEEIDRTDDRLDSLALLATFGWRF